MKYKVKSATNGTGIRTYRVSKRGKVRFRVRVETLSEMERKERPSVGIGKYQLAGLEMVSHKKAMEAIRDFYSPAMVSRIIGGEVIAHARATATRPVTIIRHTGK